MGIVIPDSHRPAGNRLKGLLTWWPSAYADWNAARSRSVDITTFWFGSLSESAAKTRLKEYKAADATNASKKFKAIYIADTLIADGQGMLGPKAFYWWDTATEAASWVATRSQWITDAALGLPVYWYISDEVSRRDGPSMYATDRVIELAAAIKSKTPSAILASSFWPPKELVQYLGLVSVSMNVRPYLGTTADIPKDVIRLGYESGGLDAYIAGTRPGYFTYLEDLARQYDVEGVLFYTWNAAAAAAWASFQHR